MVLPEAESLLTDLLGQLDKLGFRNTDALDALNRRTEMVVRNIFGDTSKYLQDLQKISYSPMVYPADADYYASSWNSGTTQLRNLLLTMLEEFQLFGVHQDSIGDVASQVATSSSAVVSSEAEPD